jgi:hypothetical protein
MASAVTVLTLPLFLSGPAGVTPDPAAADAELGNQIGPHRC